jgi:hypothetical protein
MACSGGKDESWRDYSSRMHGQEKYGSFLQPDANGKPDWFNLVIRTDRQ